MISPCDLSIFAAMRLVMGGAILVRVPHNAVNDPEISGLAA
jgi:hypothetical protein